MQIFLGVTGKMRVAEAKNVKEKDQFTAEGKCIVAVIIKVDLKVLEMVVQSASVNEWHVNILSQMYDSELF